jgi:type II secretory pathway pseudopilin PulG
VKRCPTCNKTFTDQNLSFCIDDGTPLLREAEVLDSAGDEETIVSPAAGSPDRSARPSESSYQPPGGYVPPGTSSSEPGKRKAWPWVVGLLVLALLVLAGLGIAAATFIPSLLRASNANTGNQNANVNQGDANANLNANSNAENSNQAANDNSDVAETAPPTSESDVLTTLTDVEHEWTVANINADKKKLSRILADDYVGTTSDGKTQGKADYLRTIKRDTVIQRWEFDELKVSLKGDRASLTGVLRVDALNEQREIEPLAFRFTDKFVWRDNRWQAVSSEVTPE